MEINGFNSDDYRYFRFTKEMVYKDVFFEGKFNEGDIVKINNDELENILFNSNYLNNLGYIFDHKIISYPKDKPFNLIDFLKMQDSIKFEYSQDIFLFFDKYSVIYFDDWLTYKLSEETSSFLSPFFQDVLDVRKYNSDSFQDYIIKGLLAKKDNTNIELVESKKTDLDIKRDFIFSGYQNQYVVDTIDVRFLVNVKENEEWNLKNPAVALALINQFYIRLFFSSEEILGREKDLIFEEEYKDNVSKMKRRYYELRDDIHIMSINELENRDTLSEYKLDIKYKTEYDYDRYVAGLKGNIGFCKYNARNHRDDGSIRYFYADFYDDINDRMLESELLKISKRVQKEKTDLLYKEDVLSIEEHKKYLEAIDFINKNKSKYNKGSNRLLSPIEFMEKEQEKEKQYLYKRFVSSLHSRMDKLDGQINKN